MPTGGGKSLCYQLPGLASSRLTVVVSPLIALMADQCRRLAGDGHPVVMVASGMGDERSRDALARVRDGRARIVYCSPERFGSTSFLDALAQRDVDLMAIDEAHCVSEWGHDFRPDYLRLPKAIERLGRPAVMACTATATPEVAAEIAGGSSFAIRFRSARGSIVRTSRSTPSPWRARARRRASWRCSSTASGMLANRPRSSIAAPGETRSRSPSHCGTRASSPPPTTRGCSPTSAPRRSTAS